MLFFPLLGGLKGVYRSLRPGVGGHVPRGPRGAAYKALWTSGHLKIPKDP